MVNTYEQEFNFHQNNHNNFIQYDSFFLLLKLLLIFQIVFELDMGEPVKIVTLAENLIRMYGKIPYKEVEIKFTGLRPGEKIREELLMNEEGLEKTQNKLIFIGKQLEIDSDRFIKQLWNLKTLAGQNDDAKAIQALHEIVPTFTTPEQYNGTRSSKFG